MNEVACVPVSEKKLGMIRTVVQSVRGMPVLVRWQNATCADMWVEWARGESDRCTSHGKDVWIVAQHGPEVGIEVGAFYHHDDASGFIHLCWLPEDITDGQQSVEEKR